MSVLRYCCFRWLMCLRAFVFEPLRPLACNIKLVLFWLLSRVVLWYLPVSPWSWSYIFVCMISVWLNRGRHKLVSEPTACRNPLSNSLDEVESSHYKKSFTNLAVCLTGPRRHWVMLGSFIPRLCSETLISLLFGLNDFTNSNARFSQLLPPGEPLHSRWSPTSPEDFEDTLWCSLENLCSSLFWFTSTVIPYG